MGDGPNDQAYYIEKEGLHIDFNLEVVKEEESEEEEVEDIPA